MTERTKEERIVLAKMFSILLRTDGFSTSGKRRVKKEVKGKDGKRHLQTFWVSQKPPENPLGLKKETINRAIKQARQTGNAVQIGVSSKLVDNTPINKTFESLIYTYGEENRYKKRSIDFILEKEPVLTRMEAIGIKAYLSADYENINHILRGDLLIRGNSELVSHDRGVSIPVGRIESGTTLREGGVGSKWVALGKLAKQSIEKLPTLSPESLERSVAMSNQKYAPSIDDFNNDSEWSYSRNAATGEIEGSGTLRRVISTDDVKSFASRMEIGSIVSDAGFCSTYIPVAHHEDYMAYWRGKANVEMRIDWKKDGTTQGRYVDHLKSEANEMEVLFPPGTAFRVDKVEKRRDSPFHQQKRRLAELKKIEKEILEKHHPLEDAMEAEEKTNGTNTEKYKEMEREGRDLRHKLSAIEEEQWKLSQSLFKLKKRKDIKQSEDMQLVIHLSEV